MGEAIRHWRTVYRLHSEDCPELREALGALDKNEAETIRTR